MPQQNHWIVGNADLRFVCHAPRYTEVGKLGTCILWAIIRTKDFGDAML